MSDFKMPLRPQNSNKGTFGKILNIAGSNQYIGAAYLSTLAALKVGAGYVALSTTEKVINSVSQMVPEAVFLTRKEGLKFIEKCNVTAIGCGLGTGWASTDIFLKTIINLKNSKNSVVIDADGLNILARFKNKISLPQNTILTPHPGEAARLLGTSIDEILKDTEKSAKNITEKYSCTTVLKTHRTVICNKENLYINQNGNSALAKAGSGDVLTGIISGLSAQGMDSFSAAKLGVYLHALSGEIASKELSEYSVLASDLIKYLSCAIKNCL